MKKILVLAVLAALVATQASALTIVNSKHDLSPTSTAAVKNSAAGGNTELCVYCHTPHAADMTVTKAPLWNGELTNVAANADLYTSTTMNYTTTAIAVNQTDAPLCLSCHDGTVGITLKNPPNSGTIGVTGTFNANAIILDAAQLMKNDHPIGINVPAAAVDLGIRTSGQIDLNLPGALRGTDKTVWCSSCHDVHDNAFVPFLITSNAASALCLDCHNK